MLLKLPSAIEIIESLPFDYFLDGSGAMMVVTQSVAVHVLEMYPSIKEIVSEIEQLRNLTAVYLMCNKLPPGVTVPMHRDWVKGTPLQPTKPCLERWHLPIITNEDCGFWDEENGYQHLETGFWHGPIPYWKNHHVYNVGETERIHFVVDLDCSEPVGKYEEDA